MKSKQFKILENYYEQVSGIILARQNPITGLLPASTAITAHGDYTDAWVRDNVYSILAAWGLSIAFRKVDDSQGRAIILEQSVVKLMRGLLVAMMKQSDKVEAFKYTQDPLDALHAKYATDSGDPVVGDDEWGHLQLDATSLFLLMLAQMTTAGLRIIFTMDEVHFVQNLVHYIGRAYRTPDYGIWERGNKINHGIAEVNSSSVGMAKAALEAMDGFNCFGSEGSEDSVISVVPDEIARARITLEAALPSESLSKEIDAAILSVIGYPAFAIEDPDLVKKTLDEVVAKLEGRYGCKRFLRDGHQAANEDSGRLHYEPEEMKQFENIECEWPLFFCYQLLHHLFLNNPDSALEYRQKLEGLLVDKAGRKLLPELYFVPAERIDSERENPGSQDRLPNENLPLVWAQSLFILGTLIQDGFISTSDIDPIGRHHKVGRSLSKRVQLLILAEDEGVQNKLFEYGFESQSLDEISPIQVSQADELAKAFEHLGVNSRLGLSGRPHRNLRGLATSSIYEYQGQTILFQPQFLNRHEFYLIEDTQMFIQRLKMDMAYIFKHWDQPGRPLVTVVVNHKMLQGKGKELLLGFINDCRSGTVEDIPIKLGFVRSFLPTSSKRYLDFLPKAPNAYRPDDSETELLQQYEAQDSTSETLPDDCDSMSEEVILAKLRGPVSLRKRFDLLQCLHQRYGLSFVIDPTVGVSNNLTVANELHHLYDIAMEAKDWSVTRLTAAALSKHDINLEGALTEILLRKIALSVSRQYSADSTFRQPAGAEEILRVIHQFNGEDLRAQILTQELVLNIGLLIRSRDDLFKGMTLIRTGQLLQLMASKVQSDQALSASVQSALDGLTHMTPFEFSQTLLFVLEHYADVQDQLYQNELMQFKIGLGEMVYPSFDSALDPKMELAEDWYQWRKINGCMDRYTESFYEGVWDLVNQSGGVVIGDRWDPDRCLAHSLCANMTRGEALFRQKLEDVMNLTPVPEVRRLYYEALQVLGVVLRQNPNLKTEDTIYLDVLLGHAVRLSWLSRDGHTAQSYDSEREQAWQAFYFEAPHKVANDIVRAFEFLLTSTS